MSKRKSTTSSSAAAADTYDSDNGFVEEDAPRNKKPKANKSGLKAEKGRREAGNRKAGASKEGGEIAGGGMVGKNGDGVFWEVCTFVYLVWAFGWGEEEGGRKERVGREGKGGRKKREGVGGEERERGSGIEMVMVLTCVNLVDEVAAGWNQRV